MCAAPFVNSLLPMLTLLNVFDDDNGKSSPENKKRILRENRRRDEGFMEKQYDYLKRLTGKKCKLHLYETELLLTNTEGILDSCEDGWVILQGKKNYMMFRFEDIQCIEFEENY